jgi:hypothetical protein
MIEVFDSIPVAPSFTAKETPMTPARLWTASLVVAALSVSAMVGETSAQSKDPVAGTWTLNVAKSKFAPGPPAKSGKAVITASGADGVKIVFDGVTSAGDKVHWEYTGQNDGKDYPMTGNPDADTVTLKRINASSVESTYKKGGKVTIVNVRTVSADGKTLSVTQKGTNAAGAKVDNLLVFDRG